MAKVLLKSIFTRSITGPYTPQDGDNLQLDASGGPFTVTLPANPFPGMTISFKDPYYDDADPNPGSSLNRSWAVNNITVNRNGHRINSEEDNLLLDTPGATVLLVYFDSSIGWRVY
jgi:hypothetical protein